jgi:hypothetical protein
MTKLSSIIFTCWFRTIIILIRYSRVVIFTSAILVAPYDRKNGWVFKQDWGTCYNVSFWSGMIFCFPIVSLLYKLWSSISSRVEARQYWHWHFSLVWLPDGLYIQLYGRVSQSCSCLTISNLAYYICANQPLNLMSLTQNFPYWKSLL